MALTKPETTKSEVSVEIDLNSLLGSAAKSREVREVFYQLAFDKMMKRINSGRDVDGKPMEEYSSSYKDSLAFKAFGKSSTVDMQLTGDMINSINIEKQNEKIMKIGFKDKTETLKAYAHMTGFKGHPALDGKVKPRLFFGWSDKELKEIAKEFKPVTNKANTVSDEKLIALLDKLVGSG